MAQKIFSLYLETCLYPCIHIFSWTIDIWIHININFYVEGNILTSAQHHLNFALLAGSLQVTLSMGTELGQHWMHFKIKCIFMAFSNEIDVFMLRKEMYWTCLHNTINWIFQCFQNLSSFCKQHRIKIISNWPL